ncbi:hypothetical protein EJP69_05220 [Variovorax gossypii]|uniref:Uncharacterized protein n=1 Tax=Variovorax gossypii TaxID=1679495 RepID=A0A3S0HHS6_9BURK|nr:hypothetical protein [Variovorax gossypii]RTQ37131.1 hypothetical protein EJP69_05220 [Variovorax gossypii]
MNISFALTEEQDASHAEALKKQAAINDAAALQLLYRRVSWDIVADRIELHFRSACDHAMDAGWFESMYVSRIDARRTIQLFCGQHPVGGAGERDLESGCTLVVSQSALGSVVVLFYPFESRNVRRKKSRLIWGHFDGPLQFSHSVIARMIEDFLVYERVSSALFAESSKDRRRVEKLEDRSRALEGDYTGRWFSRTGLRWLTGGSLVVTGLLFWWLFDPDKGQRLEPLVGLCTLVVGWATAQAQKYKDAIAKSEAREDAERALAESEATIAQRRRHAGSDVGHPVGLTD